MGDQILEASEHRNAEDSVRRPAGAVVEDADDIDAAGVHQGADQGPGRGRRPDDDDVGGHQAVAAPALEQAPPSGVQQGDAQGAGAQNGHGRRVDGARRADDQAREGAEGCARGDHDQGQVGAKSLAARKPVDAAGPEDEGAGHGDGRPVDRRPSQFAARVGHGRQQRDRVADLEQAGGDRRIDPPPHGHQMGRTQGAPRIGDAIRPPVRGRPGQGRVGIDDEGQRRTPADEPISANDPLCWINAGPMLYRSCKI